jgi:hypothetical protein
MPYPLEDCPTRLLHGYVLATRHDWDRADEKRKVGGYQNRAREDAFLGIKHKSKPLTPEQTERKRLQHIARMARRAQ